MGKYDHTEEQDMQIVARVHELAEKYGVKMQQVALAWHWAKGVASPIVGATKNKVSGRCGRRAEREADGRRDRLS